MREYRQHPLGVVVSPKGDPIWSEMATHITLDDEGAGAFVVVNQPNGQEGREGVSFDATEWPAIRDAIEHMLAVSQGIEAKALPKEAREK